MIRSERRPRRSPGTGEDCNPTSCPVCHHTFPSAKNMDAVVHERMLVRHITRCSSRSTSRTTTTPPWTELSQTHPRVETRTTTKRTRTNTDIHRLTHEEPNASVTNSTTMICHEEESRDHNQSIPITFGHSSYLRQDMVASATTAWSSSEEHPILKQSLRKRTAYDGNCSPQSVVVHLSNIQSLDTAAASTRKFVDLGSRSDALHAKPPEASIASRVQRKIAAAAKKSEPQTHPALQQHPSATPVPPPTQQPWGFNHVAQPPSIDTALSPVHQPPPRSPPSPLPACDSSHRRHATTTRTTTTIPVPSSSHSSRMPASAAAVQCPMCARSFPRTCFFTDQDYEQRILDHVLTCSNRRPTRTRLLTKQSSSKVQKPTVSDQEASTTSDSTSCITDGSTSTLTESIHPTKTKKRVISDPRHFLLQTWWKEPKRIKRTLPLVAFNLQQCVVARSATERCTVGVPKGRESQRLLSKHSSTIPDFKLRCPICWKEFSMNGLGSLSEESMSRHVTKCTHKMLHTGTDGVPLRWHGGSNASGDAAGKDRCGWSPWKHRTKRPLRSEDDKRHRQMADTQRAISTRSLLEGKRRKVLADMILASFMEGDRAKETTF